MLFGYRIGYTKKFLNKISIHPKRIEKKHNDKIINLKISDF